MNYLKLLSQYNLEPLEIYDNSNPKLYLRINIYKNIVNDALSATVEKLDEYEIKPFTGKEVAHVSVWVRDDFCDMLMERISKEDELQILDSFVNALKEHGFEV